MAVEEAANTYADLVASQSRARRYQQAAAKIEAAAAAHYSRAREQTDLLCEFANSNLVERKKLNRYLKMVL